MNDDVREAAENLLYAAAHYQHPDVDDLELVARYALEADDRQAALAAELGRVRATLDAAQPAAEPGAAPSASP